MNKETKEETKKRWILMIDIEQCENCNNCFLACKDEHYDNDWPPYTLAQPRHGHRWINILRKEQGTFPHISVAYLPKPCFHCADAPCIQNTSQGEIHQRADGIVIIDPEKAKGKKDLVSACPYGAIWWNEESKTPQKCTLCAHLLDEGWKAPRCVQACPTGALTFHTVEEEAIDGFIESHGLESLDKNQEPPPKRHQNVPIVLYKNLALYQKCFIAGSVATKKNGMAECVEGVVVELFQNGHFIDRQESDTFGDFRFSGLSENSGTYEIKMSWNDRAVNQSEIQLKQSCFAGTTWL